MCNRLDSKRLVMTAHRGAASLSFSMPWKKILAGTKVNTKKIAKKMAFIQTKEILPPTVESIHILEALVESIIRSLTRGCLFEI